GGRPPARAGPARPHRRAALGPDADRARRRGAEAPLPAPDSPWRRDVVPGLLRAQRRLRPGKRADPRRATRRRLGDRGAEDLDLARAVGRLVLRALPHRPGVAPPPGPVLPARADEAARRDRAADPPDD